MIKTVGRLLSYEVESNELGSNLIVDKLSEILFVQVIRSFVQKEIEHGFYGALADPLIGKALAAIHENPSQAWSAESLGQVARQSRSAFAELFS